MDTLYFLNKRTGFIRFFYERSTTGFMQTKHCIENELPPFDNPPYSEDPEPPYLEEWLDADAGLNLVGIACISMLSDTLKLYFSALQRRVIGFSFQDPKKAFKEGFVRAHLDALSEILSLDWGDCPVDLNLIEQVVLARNRGQHGDNLASFIFAHDRATLEKHPRPFFANEDELKMLSPGDGPFASFLMPTLRITPERLGRAISEVEALADWINSRLDKAYTWRGN